MGIADMCNQLGIGYDSPEGVELLEKISKLIANYAYRASALLSEEKGPSPIFNYEQYAKNPFFQESLDEETRSLVKEKGLRNIAILSIAPTGTISNVVLGFTSKNKHYVGVSGGIEPIFALAYDRRSESFGNKVFKVFHATVQAYLDLTGKTEEAKLAKDDEELKQFLPEYFFRTAHYLTPDTRVKIQGIAQKYIDHSISSTVNLPESVDPETISEVYLQAWKNKLKGITIYRDGSRYPILSVQEKQSEFQDIKKKIFSVNTREKEPLTLKGDEVFTTPGGVLSTPFHASTQQFPGVTVTPVTDEVQTTEKKENDEDSEGPKVCKIEMVNGQLVKSCSE
jgi:ribonucleoside-diphosphate reductase alpha chain